MAEGAGTARDRRRIVWAGTGLLVVLHLVVSSRVSGPSVVFDEAGYLGNARWLAGDHNWTMPASPLYSLGYPALLAPAFRFLHAPDDQWQAVRLVNALLVASLFPLLVVLLRRVFRVRWWPSVVAAAVGSVVPACVAATGSAIAENLVLPLVAANVLAAGAMVDRSVRTPARAWFGATTVALVAAHPRFVLAVPLAAGFVAFGFVRMHRDRLVAAVNGATLALGLVAVHLANQRLAAARWVEVEQLQGGRSDWWALASSWSGRGELLLGALGQSWYLAAGSAGLAVLGIAVAIGSLRRSDWAAPSFGAPSSDDPPTQLSRAALAAIGWLLALAASVFAASVTFFSMNQFRVDHYVYGRHNDSFAPVWVAVAMGFLITARPRLRLVALAGCAGVVAALGAGVVIARDPMAFDGYFSPFGAPAVTWAMEARPDRGFALATVVALVVIGSAAAVVAWDLRPPHRHGRSARAAGVVAILIAAWFCVDGATAADDTATYATLNTSRWVAPSAIERLGIDELSIDADAGRSRGALNYPFYLPGIRFLPYASSRHEQPPTAFALAETVDPQRGAAGDRIVVLDQGGLFGDVDTPEGMAVWVRPGPEQDRLAAAGRLLPTGFPAAALPVTARKAAIEIQGLPSGPVEVPSGERIPLRVHLRSTGRGAPWPDATSYGLPGRVRVGARVTPLDPGRPAGANSGGELPFWMLPGDEAYFDVGVMALDPLLEPLPPGRYRVELTLTQEGFDWATPGGPDATFTMVVTPPLTTSTVPPGG